MCPNCRAFVTTDDRVCPYCDAKLGPRAVERRAPSDVAGLIPGAQFTTALILLMNAGLYIATAWFSMNAGRGDFMNVDPLTLVLFGGKERAAVLAYGQWWRLVTAGFLHGGLIHIAMNSMGLYYLGRDVEHLYGTARYIVFYFLSTVVGFLASALRPGPVSVGASAGIFGLLGVMIAYTHRRHDPLNAAMRSQYVTWAGINLLIGFTSSAVDNAAHVGGLAAGFGLAYLAGEPKLYESWRDTAWKIAAGVCVAATAYSFFQMYLLLTTYLNRG
jgi:rhomboid protease GluP